MLPHWDTFTPLRTCGCVQRHWVPGRELQLPGALQCGRTSEVGWQAMDVMGMIILEMFGRLLGEIRPVPGPSLSSCPHLTTLVLYAPPAPSPALGHSEADLTLSLCPRKVFSVCA